MSEPLWQPRTDRAARLLGAGFFAGGAALVGFQASVVVDAVDAHDDRVIFFMAAFALGAMGIGLGATWLVRGLAGYTAVRTLQTNPRRMRVFTIMAAVVIVAATVALKVWLASRGYGQ